MAYGRALPSATVSLFSDAACTTGIGAGTTTASGDFTIRLTVPENRTTTIYGSVADNGRTSRCGDTTGRYIEDSIAPPINFVAASPPSPSNVRDVTFEGLSDPAANARVYIGSCVGTPVAATAAADGRFTVQLTVLADTTTTLVATATDAVGNTSACTPFTTYLHDGTPPPAPWAFASTPTSPGTDTAIVIRADAEVGSFVTVYRGDGCGGPPPRERPRDHRSGGQRDLQPARDRRERRGHALLRNGT